jgi:hypothetical protein
MREEEREQERSGKWKHAAFHVATTIAALAHSNKFVIRETFDEIKILMLGYNTCIIR